MYYEDKIKNNLSYIFNQNFINFFLVIPIRYKKTNTFLFLSLK
jgi:hypothetical protein